MLPTAIQRQLDRLRRRLRMLQVARAAAIWLALLAAGLALACLVDWTIDLYRDTPAWVDLLLTVGICALVAGGAGVVLVILARRMTDSQSALWLEEKRPELHHRLISAVQFHQPGADTRGMSPELIAAVTRQAEWQVQTIP